MSCLSEMKRLLKPKLRSSIGREKRQLFLHYAFGIVLLNKFKELNLLLL